MRIIFTYEGPMDNRVFRNVEKMNYPTASEYDGNVARLEQVYEGDLDTFEVRGFGSFTVLDDDGEEITADGGVPEIQPNYGTLGGT